MSLGIIGGTLLASALQAIFGIGSTMAQNAFNSPKAQKRRLREAGLPLSYMYRGNVATQSQSPSLSIDPHLGTLAAVEGRKKTYETQDLGEDIQAKGMMSGIKEEDGTEWNVRNTLLRSEARKKDAEAFISKYESDLKKIERDVEQKAFSEGTTQEMKRQALEKAKQQIKNLLAQEGLMAQLSKIRGFEEKLNQSLTENLDSMPDWISAVLKMILIASKR